MEFRTQIPLLPQRHNQIDYSSKIVLFGSCFTENISDKLGYFKFQHFTNPFGILFHPKAIENLLLNALNEKVYTEEEVFFHNEKWYCFEAHSVLSATSKDALLDSLNKIVIATNQQVQKASHFVITLGSAWVYRFIESDTIVANCHKIPQKNFLKEILSVDEIAESLEAIITLIKSINKNASILFTVSPVRHLKDGFSENTLSKSHLISAIHRIVEPRNNIHYFPSYEIVLDELRDYRFYEEDMVHPNQIAIDYIWKQFSKVWISESVKQTMQEILIIQKGLSHRPFNSKSKQHQKFLNDLNDKISLIQKEYPYISF